MPDLAPIGRRIDARRVELGLGLKQVAQLAELSVEQLRAIRYGLNSPRPLTRAAIDRAMRWEPGSAGRVIDDGAEPVPLAADAAGPQAAARPSLVPPLPAGPLADMSDDEVERLIGSLEGGQRRIAELAWRYPDPEHAGRLLPRGQRVEMLQAYLGLETGRVADGKPAARRGEAG